jgi:beta-phosphoglucomutase-like phosphatase (HAD superfamily)
VPFDAAADYQTYVDGKEHEDGVRSFLASRGITLPDGQPDDDPAADTVYGLGNRKNHLFKEMLKREGVVAFEGSRRYLEAVSGAALGIAVVSSSANAREVLDVTAGQAVVFEDALAGVAAGRAGQSEALRHNGADVIVTDLSELLALS